MAKQTNNLTNYTLVGRFCKDIINLYPKEVALDMLQHVFENCLMYSLFRCEDENLNWIILEYKQQLEEEG